jgi:hypothetical protein
MFRCVRETARALVGGEGRLGSVTRPAKLYSATIALLRRLGGLEQDFRGITIPKKSYTEGTEERHREHRGLV